VHRERSTEDEVRAAEDTNLVNNQVRRMALG